MSEYQDVIIAGFGGQGVMLAGNLLAQAMALGDIQTMDELRAVVRRSEAVHTYEPHHTPEWEAAYQKLRTFL